MEHISSKIEEEQKFEIASPEIVEMLEKTLLDFGFSKESAQEQKDIYWDDENCTITNLKRGLRFRYISGKLHNVEFKSLFMNKNGDTAVEELSLLKETGELDAIQIDKLLVSRLGYQPKSDSLEDITFPEKTISSYGLSPRIIIDKKRTIYKDASKNVEASIDIIDGLLPHIEIELIGDDYKSYINIVNKLKDLFGSKLKLTKLGYTDLITNNDKSILSKQEFIDLFSSKYDWNVLKDEEAIVDHLFLNKSKNS